MLAEYLDKAMEQAVYEIIEDDGMYWGEIPGLQGMWARHPPLEGCRRELQEAGERKGLGETGEYAGDGRRER